MKRVAIVTGAAKPDSIGHAAALGLQEEGMQVVAADLYEQGCGTLPKCLCIRTPLRRAGKPDDIAGVVAMLCSDAGSYVWP